jgi:hypothetical protein
MTVMAVNGGGIMMTLVVESPVLAGDAVLDGIEHLDFEPLTAVYIAPQACSGRGVVCLYNSNCCSGKCLGAVPFKAIFGNCG